MNSIRLFAACAAIAACVLVSGCQRKAAVNIPEATPAPAIPDGVPATEAECMDFTAKLNQALKEKDRQSIDRLISFEDLSVRCISDLGLSADEFRSMRARIASASNRIAIGTQILANIEKGGSFRLLRVRDVDGRPRPLYRQLTVEGRVNYLEFVLAKHSSGAVGVEDVFVFLTGEMITMTMRRILLPAIAEYQREKGRKLGGADTAYMDNLSNYQEFSKAVRAGQKDEAGRLYRTFPLALQRQKPIMLLYMSVAEPPEHANTVEMYRSLHPNDSSLDLISVDYHFRKKQYGEALRCLERIEKSLGGDPYLIVMRANIQFESNRLKEAKASAEEAAKAEPTLEQAYWTRITISLDEKNHADTLAWLKRIVEKCDMAIGDLRDGEEYAEFVKSPQHAEWVKWYDARMK